jgi:hypothetical protein
MPSMQVEPVSPSPSFDGTQGQLDALLAAVVAIIETIPESMKPAMTERLKMNQWASWETALPRGEYSDDYLQGHDRMVESIWPTCAAR